MRSRCRLDVERRSIRFIGCSSLELALCRQSATMRWSLRVACGDIGELVT